MDIHKYLNITPNPNDSFRLASPLVPDLPPTSYNNDSTNKSQYVASIDVPLNTTTNTWIRVFHPLNLPSSKKLPIIIYFHGGGFLLFSPASMPFHNFCNSIACELPAIVLSVAHRLAPEFRLPSAYEDAVDAMLWLKEEALHGVHEFSKYADFSECFLMGISSGGNLAYHAGLRAVNVDLESVKITGLIMNQPFFGGVERTGSELKYVNDRILPLTAGDFTWEHALPVGADRDHEYCNPMSGSDERLEIKMLPRCYVRGYGGDPLIDRQKEFVKMLEGHGVSVVAHFCDGGFHTADMSDPEEGCVFLMDLKDFINASTTDAAGAEQVL